MERIRSLCNECLDEGLYRIIISNRRKPGSSGNKGISEGSENKGTPGSVGSKVMIRPLLLKGELCFQVSETRDTQIFHFNMKKEEVTERILKYLTVDFCQAEFCASRIQATVLISKKGKLTIKRKLQQDSREVDLSHNKVKKYILPEGDPVPFLVDLGVQTPEGKIVRSKYDKFRQINRYLEFIADAVTILPKERPINIIDFGCGKSYLTFALYYYMKVICKWDIRITGLDLKEKVIEDCNRLAEKYGFEHLHFVVGDVSGYETTEPVDMVVTLHACDTATDYALERAVSWKAKVILSVPCCQHEVNGQIQNELLEPLLKYGLIKERMAALITDAIRANLLEEQGYQVQVMEFIDMEHTPKNILIRAIRDGQRKKETKIRETTDFLQVENTLQKLFEKK